VGHVTQIAREALSNVVQHAAASHVTVNLTYAGEFTRLMISDNGQGMDLAALAAGNGQGQGMANMRARAEMLGGTLDLESQIGHGCCLTLSIPCGDKSACD